MCSTRQVVILFVGLFVTCCVDVKCLHLTRPFEFKQQRIGSDEPYAELFEERLSEADVKKLNETIVAPSVGTARFGGPHTGVADQAKDNGILGAGIDFGLPDGSGVGYGEEAPFKHSFSVTRLSYFFK